MAKPITVQSVIAKGDCRKSFGKSLYLVVRGGSARWEYQYRPKGSKTVKSIWLGSAIGDNKVSLMDARAKREEQWLKRRNGNGVQTQAPAMIAAAVPAIAATASNDLTFGKALSDYLAERAPHWRGGVDGREARQWRSGLAESSLAPLTLGEITEATKRDALMVFPQIQRERMRKRVNAVVKYMFTGESKPRRAKPKQMAAMPWAEVPEFYDMLIDIDKPVARALRWTILTAGRTSETLGATWAEINGDTWTVPANRIKAGREHRVPLTDAMRACLGPRGADGDKVFGLIGAMEMQRLLKRYHDYTVHGFRSAFVTWAQENGYPFELREIALAHRVGDATSQAYNRGDQKHLRLELMQALEPIQEAKWHNSSLEHRAQIVYR